MRRLLTKFLTILIFSSTFLLGSSLINLQDAKATDTCRVTISSSSGVEIHPNSVLTISVEAPGHSNFDSWNAVLRDRSRRHSEANLLMIDGEDAQQFQARLVFEMNLTRVNADDLLNPDAELEIIVIDSSGGHSSGDCGGTNGHPIQVVEAGSGDPGVPVAPSNCPQLEYFVPNVLAGEDATGRSISAYLTPVPGKSQFSYYVRSDEMPHGQANDLRVIAAKWVASLGQVSGGQHILYVYDKTGVSRPVDYRLCYTVGFFVNRSDDVSPPGSGGPGLPVIEDITSTLSSVGDILHFGSVGEIISALLPFVWGLAAMLALLYLIWGGTRYMLARGDPKEMDAARGVLTSAVIGLLIIVLSASIFWIIGGVFKVDILDVLKGPIVRPAYAVEPVDIGCEVKLANGECVSSAFPNVGAFFTRIVRIALAAGAALFLGLVVFGGFRYLNSGGDPKAVDSARQTITGAIVGLLIIVGSFIIIELLIKAIGIPGVNTIFGP